MPWLGSQRSMGPMLRALVYDSPIGWPDATSGSGFQLVVAPSLVTPSYDLLYLKRAALLCHRKAFQFSLILAVKSRYLTLA